MTMLATNFKEGDPVKYVIGSKRSGKPVIGVHTHTFLRYVGNDRAVIRNSPDEVSAPEKEYEVWVSRLVRPELVTDDLRVVGGFLTAQS